MCPSPRRRKPDVPQVPPVNSSASAITAGRAPGQLNRYVKWQTRAPKDRSRKVHFVLLTDPTATNQQLRITHNNFCLFACNQGCRRLLTVLSTVYSAVVVRLGVEVVTAQKEKK